MSMHSNRTHQSLKLIQVVALTGRDAITDVAFPIWMAPEILFIRKAYDRGSLVTILKRLPSSLRKSLDFGPTVAHVSTATGRNWYMLSRCIYFLVLSSSACAAPPGSVVRCSSAVWLAKSVDTCGIPHQIHSLLPGNPAWSPHQSASHLLNVTQKALAERVFLQLWGHAG